MPDKIIKTRDPFGNLISCTQRRWNDHIVKGHDELNGREREVAHVIESPEVVYRSVSHSAERYVACSSNLSTGKTYLKVVVHVSKNTKTGNLVTAFTSKNIGGENVDVTEKLYPEDTL